MSNWGQVKVKLIGQEGKVVSHADFRLHSVQNAIIVKLWVLSQLLINSSEVYKLQRGPTTTHYLQGNFFICKEAALKVQMSVCICVCLSVSNVQFNSGYTGLYRSIYWQMILLVLSGTGDSHTIVYLMTGKFFVCERIFKKEDCCMHEIYISVNKHMARDHSLSGVPNIGIKPGSI